MYTVQSYSEWWVKQMSNPFSLLFLKKTLIYMEWKKNVLLQLDSSDLQIGVRGRLRVRVLSSVTRTSKMFALQPRSGKRVLVVVVVVQSEGR